MRHSIFALVCSALLAILFAPHTSWARADLFWHCDGSISTVASEFCHYNPQPATGLGETRYNMPTAGRARKLYAYCPSMNLSAGSVAFIFRRNGTDTSLTCSLSGTTTVCSDLVNQADWVAGDDISLRTLPSGASGTIGQCYLSMHVSDTDGTEHDSIMTLSAGAQVHINGRLCGPAPVGDTCNLGGSNGDDIAQWNAPSATTLTGLGLHLSTATMPAGASMTVTIVNGGVDTDLSCTISEGTDGCVGTCTTNCAVAQGALVYGRLDISGTPGAQDLSLVLEHTGAQLYGRRSTTTPTTAAGSYYSSSGLSFAAADVRQPYILPHGGTIQNLHARSGNGSVATDAVITVCSNSTTPTDCAGTRPTTTVSATNTTYSDLANVLAVGQGEFFEVQLTKTESLSTANIGFFFEIAGPEDPPVTSTPSPTNTPSVTPTSTDTPTPLPSQTPTMTDTATETPTATPTHTPTSSPSSTPTPTATATATEACLDEPFGTAGHFDLFAIGEMRLAQSEVAGSAAAGGDVDVIKGDIGTAMASLDDVIVSGANLKVRNSTLFGDAVYATSAQIKNTDFLNGGQEVQGTPIDFGNAATSLHDLCALLAGTTANGQTAVSSGAVQFVGNSTVTNVFHIESFDLNNATAVSVDVPFGATALIVVDGTTDVTLRDTVFALGATDPADVLLSFTEVGSVNIDKTNVPASVLAAKSGLRFTDTTFFGPVAAASIDASGFTAGGAFEGCIKTDLGES